VVRGPGRGVGRRRWHLVGLYLVEVQVHRSYKSVDLYLDEIHTLLPTDVLSPGIEEEE
jgi:hypothetical protein